MERQDELLNLFGAKRFVTGGAPAATIPPPQSKGSKALKKNHVRNSGSFHEDANHGDHKETSLRYDKEAAAKLAWHHTLDCFGV